MAVAQGKWYGDKHLALGVESPPSYECSGPYDFESIATVLNQVSRHLKVNGCATSLQRRVHMALVEMVENLYRHGQLVKEEAIHSVSVSMWIPTPEEVVLQTINPVLPEDRSRVGHWLETANSKDHQGVQRAIGKALVSDRTTPRGGAGLGLLTVCRLQSDIAWCFVPTGRHYDLFTLIVRVR